MSIIQINNVTFAYPNGSENVFTDLNLRLDSSWKLGLVGRNGRGKTTFLKLLLGKLDYRGNITSSLKFEYFPYPVVDEDQFVGELLQEIAPTAQEWEVVRELSYLGMEADSLWLPFSTLSKGQQTKVLLAGLFLKPDCFLLIDEPTNHLDVAGRKLVANYLKKKTGFILVSHDRNFLDACIDHVLSLNRADISLTKGDFSTWLQNFENEQANKLAQNDRLKKEVKRLKTAARQSASWSDKVERSKNGTTNSGSKLDKGYVGHKSAKMMQRSKSLQKRQTKELAAKEGLLNNLETISELKLSPLTFHEQRLAWAENLQITYSNGWKSKAVSFELKQGQRLALTGANGSGKSSLLKLFLGQAIPYQGNLTVKPQLKISYLPQDASFLAGPIKTYAEQLGIDETLLFTLLRKLDFERDLFSKDMTNFSEGQKKKVLIAASLCQSAHLYIWDEPLNYIDIYARMQLEALLAKFKPTMILVEHDEYFLQGLATDYLKL
ncbi:ABC-F type ribosomal protection protein [Ligilactobacillus agilis]|uniref:ribosomal protection-like ABC-F family protein n=1 Tax=Ligilactobacillus agilis TaxID=1601 RepID=UPI00191F7AE4|nr:ABC-F type ribosomal protection protein [Ligilactobacillus agilis]MBL1055725.1 ABC-F type ribosomal protection protein [Ligilactobacillus agilis]